MHCRRHRTDLVVQSDLASGCGKIAFALFDVVKKGTPFFKNLKMLVSRTKQTNERV